jgi:phage shock protein A
MKMTLEKLGTMVNSGFSSLQEQINTVKVNLGALEFDIKSLKQGQETILLRLDQYAYKIDVDNLNRRVSRLEERIEF